MRQWGLIFNHQRKLFFHDKGMIWFYLGGILVFGIIFPLVLPSESPQFIFGIFMTVTLQKQWAAESVAGERENLSLESLLSTPVSSKALLFGKSLFNFVCAVIYYALIMTCILLSRRIGGVEGETAPPSCWLLLALASSGTFFVIALYGIQASAKAESVRDAGRKATVISYLSAFLLAVLAALLTGPDLAAWTDTVIVSLFYLGIMSIGIIYLSLRLIKINRPCLIVCEEMENRAQKPRVSYTGEGSPSQVQCIFSHEWRYFCTLKGLILMFCVLTLSPAIFLLLGKYYLGQNNIYYAIIITIFMLPRVPSNLVAYSVGGEKAYKTAESILSTPVSMKALLLGKSAVPMLICLIMLAISSGLTLIAANLIGRWEGSETLILYDGPQSILLFGVGTAASIGMIFAAAILSLTAKNPRKGLYVSTILGCAFILPLLAIVYLFTNKMLGALTYLGVLIAADIVIFQKISRVTRPDIMVRL